MTETTNYVFENKMLRKYLNITWGTRVIIAKLTLIQVVTHFLAFYGTQSFMSTGNYPATENSHVTVPLG
jgi:hypothetical protein